MLSRPFTRFVARLRAAVGSDAAGLRQALAALLVSSGGDLLAGLTLGAITGTLEALPGLLVLVPAAIGMRGNIFGALGSRLGTSIHTGTFSLSRRRDTVVGQNVVAVHRAHALRLGRAGRAGQGGGRHLRRVRDDLAGRLPGDLDHRRRAELDRRAGPHARRGVAVGAARLGHGQRGRPAGHRGGRHGHAAVAVPGHLPGRHQGGHRHRSRCSPALVAVGSLVWAHAAEAADRAAASCASRCRCCWWPASSTWWPASPSSTSSSRSSPTRPCWCWCRRSSRTPARWAACCRAGWPASSTSASSSRSASPAARRARRLRHRRPARRPRVHPRGHLVADRGGRVRPGQPGRAEHDRHLAASAAPSPPSSRCSSPTTAASPPTGSGSTPTTTACRC